MSTSEEDETDINPFVPATAAPGDNGLEGQWKNYLSDPATLAAVASFGMQLGRPAWGQTGITAFGDALGAAGESARMSEAMGLKRREVSSKAELRGAQAGAAEARAGAAGSRADAATMRMQLEQARQEGLNSRNLLNARVTLSQRYNAYRKDTQAANDNPLADATSRQPILSYNDWLADRGMSELIGTQGSVAQPGVQPTAPVPGQVPGQAPKAPGRLPPPKVGEVKNGMRFIGGNPASQDSWEPL